ncbi:MAG: ferrous iron transporter B, partial [Deltaproteobacteria bacterium]
MASRPDEQDRARERGGREAWIAIAGNPNTGKTSLFNAITGLRQKVGNYPGVTVERRLGIVPLPSGRRARCIDLPGCYSLVARSHDEQIAHDVLVGQVEDTPEPDLVVIVVDASNLERNLYLASQILDLGIPCVIALNMIDVAEDAGLEIDHAKLGSKLGVPVVPTVAVREQGIDDLLATVERVLARPNAGNDGQRPWRMDDAIEREVAGLAAELGQHNVRPGRADAEAIWLLSSVREHDELAGINPHIRAQVLAIQERLEEAGTPFRTAEIQARYAWIDQVARACVRIGERRRKNWTGRLDALFTHRIAGPVIFFGVMALVFQSIFAWADPAIRGIEYVFAGLSNGIRMLLPPGALRDLLTEGVIAGAGNVVV